MGSRSRVAPAAAVVLATPPTVPASSWSAPAGSRAGSSERLAPPRKVSKPRSAADSPEETEQALNPGTVDLGDQGRPDGRSGRSRTAGRPIWTSADQARAEQILKEKQEKQEKELAASKADLPTPATHCVSLRGWLRQRMKRALLHEVRTKG